MGVLEVESGDEILVTTVGGVVIRCPVEDIRVTGRAAKGVRIQRPGEGDKVSAIVRLVTAQDEDAAVAEGATPAPPRDGSEAPDPPA